MKQVFYTLTLLFCSITLFSQTSYTGFIDRYPIELVADIYTDGDARAIYAYSNVDEPIVVDGMLQNNKLILYERDNSGKSKATLTFDNFNAAARELKGSWTDLNNGKQLQIRLTKLFSIETGDGAEWKDKELLQPVSVKDKYFKLMVSKAKGDFEAKVTGIKIIEKKTDKLVQRIDLDCQLWGLESVTIGDFNFDGITDFSVFERSLAGPNTTSLYFLFDNKAGKFYYSGFEGVSLTFDAETKRIYEHNECCAGRRHMNAEYELVNNKMVFIKRNCVEYSEEKKDFVPVKCE